METVNTIGRRKSAIARIYLTEGKGNIIVNGRDYKSYFHVPQFQYVASQPFNVLGIMDKYDVKVNLSGGGYKGQAEALRLAIARALIKINPEDRKVLKDHGFLTRDPRAVERKKPGQPGARKRFQFSKR